MARTVFFTTAIILFLSVSPVFSAESDTLYIQSFKIETAKGFSFSGKDGKLTSEGFTGIDSNSTPVFVPREDISSLYKEVIKKNSGKHFIAGVTALIIGGGYYLANTGRNKPSDSHKTPVIVNSVGLAITSVVVVEFLASGKKWEQIPLEMSLQYNPVTNNSGFLAILSF